MMVLEKLQLGRVALKRHNETKSREQQVQGTTESVESGSF
jgi:hypothetical protein